MTTSSQRTDVHRPAALVTEDYEYVLSFDQHPENGDRRQLQAYLARTGRHFAENESAGGCFHCGAHIRYAAVLLHKPTGDLVKVGETCLENRFDLATADFHELRKRAQLDRQAQRIKRRRAVWFAIDQDRQVAYEWATHMVIEEKQYGYEGMRFRFISTINRYGDTSDKFVRAIMRDMVRTERREEERAALDAERACERAQAEPVEQGTGVTITGEVVSIKWQENDYGDRHVMTVKDDRGFLVWGSVPMSLEATFDEATRTRARGVERGDRITFVANVEQSDTDWKFGFFKRPRRAEFAS